MIPKDRRQLVARIRRLERMLVAARGCIYDELAACGPDEIRTNPQLQSKGRVLGRIDRALKDKLP